ncbi:MAG: TonB-dependent receptor [Puniceicoccaceae bacterium]
MKKNTIPEKAGPWKRLSQILLVVLGGLLLATPYVQAQADNEEVVDLQPFTVLGSAITRFDQESGLPVSMLTMDDIEAGGSISPGEIFTEMVWTGSPEFEESSDGPNDARGDVTSVNLRGAGPGQTLMLLNGRRLAPHPLNQTVNQTPSVLVNANIIPAGLIERVDVLRDGASAIYGTDASAGVVNTLLESDFIGNKAHLRYGTESDGNFTEFLITYTGGFDFNDGKSNLSVFVSYFDRDPIMAKDRDYALAGDKSIFVDTDKWDGPFDRRSSHSPWGRFENTLPGSRDQLFQNGVAITDGTGDFHIHNPAFTGDDDDSRTVLADGTLLGYDSLPRNERLNIHQWYTLTSKVERKNAFLSFNHKFSDNLKLFAEAGYYQADSWQQRAPSVSLGFTVEPLIIPAQNYWNPFGPKVFSNGQVNPNRLEGITLQNGDPLPDEGISIKWEGWRSVDLGPRIVTVDSESYIATLGLSGKVGDNWYWETGLRYNINKATDLSENRMSKTKVLASLALETPLALNMFAGPGVNGPEVWENIEISTTRTAETELLNYDLRINNPEIIELFGNPVGIAFGFEARGETYMDDRDPRLDGTIIWNDDVPQNISDVVGVSPTPDSDASRDVVGLYAETLIPIVGESNRMPLVHRLEFQVAGRWEDYSDFGEVKKPKYGAMWYLSPDILLRASHAKGFTAPNLSLLTSIQRSTTGVVDDYRRQWDPGNSDNTGAEYIPQLRNNLGLGPEQSKTDTAGIVFRVPFIEGLTLTTDYWRIKIDDRIGTIGPGDITEVDRDILNGLSPDPSLYSVGDVIIGDPRVERAPIDQEIMDLAAAEGYAPAGAIIRIIDPFVNEASRTIEGWDFGLEYAMPERSIGKFTLKFEGSYLKKMDQVEIEGDDPFSLIKFDVNPRFRGNTTLRWRKDNWNATVSYYYISETEENNVTDTEGNDWVIESYQRVNVAVGYRFTEGMFDGLSATFGIRNIFDEDPPLNPSERRGYETSLHSNRERFFYLDLKYRF